MGRHNTLRKMIGFAELTTDDLHRAVIAEFLGTLVFVLGGCAAAAYSGPLGNFLSVAIATGLLLASVIQALGDVSGAHVNPAVTVGMLVGRYCSVARALLFLLFQSAGAVAGAGLLYVLLPEKYQDNLGVVTKDPDMTELQAFGMEALLTFILVLTIMGVCDERRTNVKEAAPLAIGLVAVANITFGGPYSGACMNPVRALGPAVILKGDAWNYQWVYWAGPLVGGALGSAVRCYLFRAPKPDRHHHAQNNISVIGNNRV